MADCVYAVNHSKIHCAKQPYYLQGIHCIGDRANHEVLKIYEELLEEGGANVTERRPRIEHAQIFSPEDLEKIGRLGGTSLFLMSILSVAHI